MFDLVVVRNLEKVFREFSYSEREKEAKNPAASYLESLLSDTNEKNPFVKSFLKSSTEAPKSVKKCELCDSGFLGLKATKCKACSSIYCKRCESDYPFVIGKSLLDIFGYF
jgi:hypothetical protein